MAAPANASQARRTRGDIYRPAASTIIQSGLALLAGTGLASGVTAKTQDVNGQVDLTLPLRGIRFIFKGRVSVGTASYSAVNPESLLQLVSKIRITGNYKGNGKTILDCSLATLFGAFAQAKFQLGSVKVNGTQLARPAIPYANVAALTTGASPYDFIIKIDVPFHPLGWKKRTGAGFLMRQEDWTNVNIHIESPALPDNAANALGTSAATTVTNVTAFGSGAGAMTVDIYGLPVRMGKAAAATTPGLCTRVEVPLTSATLQAAMSNTQIALLDKQATPKIFFKFGLGTAFPIFTALSDTVVNALGFTIGTNENVRQLVDVEAVRSEIENEFETPGTQGYFAFDFIGQDENFDSAYPADALKDNQPPKIVANGPGTGNAQGSMLQEEIVVHPQGPLFG